MAKASKETLTKRAKSSRRRGKRGEYVLRDYFRAIGYQSDRVPTSGAAQGFKGDVTFAKNGVSRVAELKNWSGTFKKVYDLYFEHLHLNKSDILSFSLGHLCIDVSTSVDSVFAPESVYAPAKTHPLFKKYSRTFNRFATLQVMKQESDVFVVKDNRMPFLFIRFR